MTEKQIPRFVCDKCRTSYASAEDALRCEEGHIPAKRVRDQKYVALTNDRTGYPTYVSLVMGDGRIVRYRRC